MTGPTDTNANTTKGGGALKARLRAVYGKEGRASIHDDEQGREFRWTE